jgi:hypothetical protein
MNPQHFCNEASHSTKQDKTHANNDDLRAKTTNSTSMCRKQHQKNRSQCASELTQQINDSKPSPHCKEVAIKTMHTTTMCNDIAEDKCNIKKQVEMNITGKYFAYLVEFPSSKKKLVSLRPFNESRKMSMHCAFGYRQSNLGYGIVKLRMHLMMEQ